MLDAIVIDLATEAVVIVAADDGADDGLLVALGVAADVEAEFDLFDVDSIR